MSVHVVAVARWDLGDAAIFDEFSGRTNEINHSSKLIIQF